MTNSENQEEGSALSYPQIVTRMGGGDVVTHSLSNVDGCGECSEDCPLLPSYPQAIVTGRATMQWTDKTPGRCKIMCSYIPGVVMGLMVTDAACHHSMEL